MIAIQQYLHCTTGTIMLASTVYFTTPTVSNALHHTNSKRHASAAIQAVQLGLVYT